MTDMFDYERREYLAYIMLCKEKGVKTLGIREDYKTHLEELKEKQTNRNRILQGIRKTKEGCENT